MTTTDVILTPTEREAVLRLAHGARIRWTLGGQSITIGTGTRPFTGCQLPVGDGLWCKLGIAHTEPCHGVPADQLPPTGEEPPGDPIVPEPVFDRLRELEFLTAEAAPAGTVLHVLSTPGRAWADANIDMREMPTTGPLPAERDPVTGNAWADSVTLSATARDAVLRLGGGARIIHETSVRRITIGKPSTGYTTLRRPAFDRLVELGFIEMTAEGPHSCDYRLSLRGEQWAQAHIARRQVAAAAWSGLLRPARPIERQPLCTDTPVPFEDDPAVCDRCGNLIDAHPVEPEMQQRITEAMWRVVIALGGPHNVWSGGDDEQTSLHFREHMAACGIDWAHTTRPEMEDVGVSHDSETSGTVQLMGGWLRCLCLRVNDQITVRDLTPGQLMWHVAHIDDAPPLATA